MKIATFLLFLNLALAHGLPLTLTSTSDDSDGDSESYANFDSQRHTNISPPLPQPQSLSSSQVPVNSSMIVRVIVTSSSSSSSSDSSDSVENVGNDDYAAYHHDFSFPIISTSSTSPPTTTTTTAKPPRRIKTSRRTTVKSTTTTTSTSRATFAPAQTPANFQTYENFGGVLQDKASSPERPVEDIFSAFYRAFSQNSRVVSDSSDNVERFQVYFPQIQYTTTTTPSTTTSTSERYIDYRYFGQNQNQQTTNNRSGDENLDKNVLRREIPSNSKELKVVAVSKTSSSSVSSSRSYNQDENSSKLNVKSMESNITPEEPTSTPMKNLHRIVSTSISKSFTDSDQNLNPIPITFFNQNFENQQQPENNQQIISTSTSTQTRTFPRTRSRSRRPYTNQRVQGGPIVKIFSSSSSSISDSRIPSPGVKQLTEATKDHEPFNSQRNSPKTTITFPSSEQPKASPLVQQQQLSTSTTTQTPKSKTSYRPRTTSQRSWHQPEKNWAEEEKSWAQSERSWAQAEKVWGQQEKSWGLPEQAWVQNQGRSAKSNARTGNFKSTTTTTTLKPFTTKTTLPPPVSSSQYDSDYPQDSPYDNDDGNGDKTPEVETPPASGSFVILGDDETEQDSIDGEFDHHLGIPLKLMPPSRSQSTPTLMITREGDQNNPKSSQISISTISSSSGSHHKLNNNFNFSYFNNSFANFTNSQSQPSSSSASSSSSYTSSNSDTINNPESKISTSSSTSANTSDIKKGKKFGYVLEGSNVRRYRVEERTPDGFIVGEYGVLNNQNAFLRGVRYTADGTINPRLIHEALMKFLALRRR